MFKFREFYGIYLLVLLLALLFFVRCDFGIKNVMKPLDPVAIAYNGLAYAGSETCSNCHENIFNQHLKTAHHKTSQLVSKENVIGDFSKQNTLNINDRIYYKMTDEDQLYQSAYKDEELVRKEPFDIIIGSGTKGQSYLYWKSTQLFQLPISYWNESKNWIQSPGYSSNQIYYDRQILPNCLECHTTFAKNHLPNDVNSNRYVKNQMVLGIDCESCHGPSLRHVNAHRKKPELKNSQYITAIKTLSRQQQIDACAKCHSGVRKPLQAPFKFKTGDRLNDFYRANYKPTETATLDVHGNQYGLLSSSDCFKNSETLNCSTCHNPHKNERDQFAHFSEKCLNCHQDTNIHSFTLNRKMQTNCINCHMPLLPSSSLTVKTLDRNGEKTSDSLKVRTHKIGIYSDISDRIYPAFSSNSHLIEQ